MSQAFSGCDATMMETEKVLDALIRFMRNDSQPSAYSLNTRAVTK
jgi:hypothetical protein